MDGYNNVYRLAVLKKNLLCAYLKVHFLKKLNNNLINVCGLNSYKSKC